MTRLLVVIVNYDGMGQERFSVSVLSTAELEQPVRENHHSIFVALT